LRVNTKIVCKKYIPSSEGQGGKVYKMSLISFFRQTNVLVLEHRSFLGLAALLPAALPVGSRPPSSAAGSVLGGKPCTSGFPNIF
jgi:hypothetical protein